MVQQKRRQGKSGPGSGWSAAAPAGVRDERDLDRLLAAGDQVQALLELGERQLMGADLVHRQDAGLQHPDRRRPGVRAQVGAEHVQLLVVADDRPVDADVAAEDAVLDIGAQLAQDVEALGHGRGMPGAFEVDVGPVAAGHVLDRGDRIVLADVDRHIGAALERQRELVRGHVERHDLGRVLRPGPGDHAETDRPAAGHHDDVVERQVRPLDGVQRAGQRLDERRVRRRQVGADLVHQGVSE